MEPEILREIYLIRHGESLSNIGIGTDTPEGNFDPLLSPFGEKQIESVGRYLAEKELDVLYSSGLRRAVQTAAAVAKYQPKAKEINLIPKLCEISISPDYSGHTLDELKSLVPQAKLKYAEGIEKENFAVPDPTPWEDEARYFNRVKEVLDYIDERYNSGEKIGIVGHAGLMTYFIFYILGYRDAQPNMDFSLYNTSITKIRFYKPGTYPYGDVIFRYINRVNHLEKYPVDKE